eukprot:465651_1
MSLTMNQQRKALLTQLHDLRASKLRLLHTGSNEIRKLRVFITILGKIEKERQCLSSEQLREIETFHMRSNSNSNHTIQLNQFDFVNEQYSSVTNTKLQQEIEALKESKLKLLLKINAEINNMRDIIRSLMYNILHPKKYTQKQLLNDFEVNWKLQANMHEYRNKQILPCNQLLNALRDTDKLLEKLVCSVALNEAHTKLLICGFLTNTSNYSDIVDIISKFIDEIIMIDGTKFDGMEQTLQYKMEKTKEGKSRKINAMAILDLWRKSDTIDKGYVDEWKKQIDKLMSLRALDLYCEWHGSNDDGTMAVKKKHVINAIKKLLNKQQPSMQKLDTDKYVPISDWYFYWKPYLYIGVNKT